MDINSEIYLKLFLCGLFNVVLSGTVYLLKQKTRFGKMKKLPQQIIVGVLFGLLAILGTEHGVDVGGATANARDAAPLCAGLLFGAPAGITAGIIGGVERWFAVAWGAGMYSRLACSVSTIFAGFYAGLLRKIVFDSKRPSPILGFVIGGVMEVIHMTVLFITHLTDSEQAMSIVKICLLPMTFCNGISVFLSVLMVVILSSGVHRAEKRYRNISQLFQLPMLIVVVLAYLASTSFVYLLQTYSAKTSAVDLIKLNIADVKQEILDASDKHILSVTREIADEVEASATENGELSANLKELAKKYGVSDIWYVNDEGIVTDASDGNVGYDMNSDADLPEDQQQSCKFLVLLTDECDEYVQEYRSLHQNNRIKKKMAGVSLKSGGFIQVSYNAELFQNELSKQAYGLTTNRHIGETGHIVILDKKKNLISEQNNEDENYLDFSQFTIDKNTPINTEFEISIDGTKCLVIVSQVEGYYIVAALPESEAYGNRSDMFYINSFMEVIIFSALFIMIYIIIRKVVVNNLHKVNKNLNSIINGNLDTTINIKSSEEFVSLSDYINSTVTTLKKYIDEASSRIDKELAFARSIQYSALPSIFPPFPDKNEFDIFASMDTAKEVGGDFYDFYMLDNNRLAFLIADVSGKGIPAAMFMMTAKTMLKSLAESGLSVDEVFTKANEKLCEGNEADMFVTAWMGILDTETGKVEFANAGHNPPLISHNGKYEYLRSKPGFILAGMPGVKYKKQETVLNPGDKIFLYTDGVTESTNSKQELYGEDRLADVLNFEITDDVETTLKKTRESIDQFVEEAEQFDDITMLIVDYHGNTDKMEYKLFPASVDSLDDALSYITEKLEAADALEKSIMQISVAFEEMFVNVAHYAYPDKQGDISVGISAANHTTTIQIKDTGIPFNPFAKENPDITQTADERQIGGLGIFMTKKIMDEVNYEYKEGYNIVTMKKTI